MKTPTTRRADAHSDRANCRRARSTRGGAHLACYAQRFGRALVQAGNRELFSGRPRRHNSVVQAMSLARCLNSTHTTAQGAAKVQQPRPPHPVSKGPLCGPFAWAEPGFCARLAVQFAVQVLQITVAGDSTRAPHTERRRQQAVSQRSATTARVVPPARRRRHPVRRRARTRRICVRTVRNPVRPDRNLVPP